MAFGNINYPGAQPISESSATQKHPLGTVVKAVDPDKGEAEFVYLKGVASTVVGSSVRIVDGHGTALLAATDTSAGQPVAFAMSANVANQFGWYAVRGRVPANFAGAAVAGAALQAAAAGTVDDTATVGDYISGAVVAATVGGAGLGDVYLHYPTFGNV